MQPVEPRHKTTCKIQFFASPCLHSFRPFLHRRASCSLLVAARPFPCGSLARFKLLPVLLTLRLLLPAGKLLCRVRLVRGLAELYSFFNSEVVGRNLRDFRSRLRKRLRESCGPHATAAVERLSRDFVGCVASLINSGQFPLERTGIATIPRAHPITLFPIFSRQRAIVSPSIQWLLKWSILSTPLPGLGLL